MLNFWKRFFKQLLLNFYILMRKLMLIYFVADILGIYYFFHVVQDDHILGFMHLKYTKVKNIRNISFSEKERAQIILILIATLY